MSPFRPTRAALMLAASALTLLAACNEPLDFDLRDGLGSPFDTSAAAQQASAPRPQPDNRGVISYPNYQVAVARRGDTLSALASRVGADPAALARYNGIQTGDTLREGEIVALPTRVAEPSPATGAIGTGPIRPAGQIDITTLAGSAIDNAPASAGAAPAATPPRQPQTGQEPVRHKVVRGETAYTVSRLYGVSVRSLAEWNGLGPDFGIREGQYLLIPVAAEAPPPSAATTAPGTGSPTPTPPSAGQPLPQQVASAPTPAPEKLGGAAPSSARMTMPVDGKIIREYAKGRNEGIAISAAAGAPVRAAAGGTVAAVTSDADQRQIVVIRHPDNLLTVYANVDQIKVKKGDTVTRGQDIAALRSGQDAFVHFEVRNGFESVDPMPYVK